MPLRAPRSGSAGRSGAMLGLVASFYFPLLFSAAVPSKSGKAALSEAPQWCVLSSMARMCGGSVPGPPRAALRARVGAPCQWRSPGRGRERQRCDRCGTAPRAAPAFLKGRGRHLRAEGLQGNRSKKKMSFHARSWIWKSLQRKLKSVEVEEPALTPKWILSSFSKTCVVFSLYSFLSSLRFPTNKIAAKFKCIC